MPADLGRALRVHNNAPLRDMACCTAAGETLLSVQQLRCNFNDLSRFQAMPRSLSFPVVLL